MATVVSEEKEKKLTKRELAVAELLSTEDTYVTQLQNLISYYVSDLENSQILNSSDYNSLFPSLLRTICNLNTQLYSDLVSRCSQCPSDLELIISDILISFFPFFKMYQQYMSCAAAQVLTLQRVLNNSKFYNFQQETRKHFNNLPLTSLLILPVQRIPRYKLLISEICKRTGADHCDFDGLNNAYKLICDVNMENNSKLADFEARMIATNIVSEIDGASSALISPNRKFVFCGELSKFHATNHKKHVCLLFYIFNDCVVYASPLTIPRLNKKSKFKMLLPIDSAFDVRIINDDCFAIRSSLESFVVSSKTIPQIKWIETFKQCIDNAKANLFYHENRDNELIKQAPLVLPKELQSKSTKTHTKQETAVISELQSKLKKRKDYAHLKQRKESDAPVLVLDLAVSKSKNENLRQHLSPKIGAFPNRWQSSNSDDEDDHKGNGARNENRRTLKVERKTHHRSRTPQPMSSADKKHVNRKSTSNIFSEKKPPPKRDNLQRKIAPRAALPPSRSPSPAPPHNKPPPPKRNSQSKAPPPNNNNTLGVKKTRHLKVKSSPFIAKIEVECNISVIWRHNDMKSIQNQFLYRRMKSIVCNVLQFCDNKSALKCINTQMNENDNDMFIIVNGQNHQSDQELVRMIRQNLKCESDILIYNNLQIGIYQTNWISKYENVTHTSTQDKLLKILENIKEK